MKSKWEENGFLLVPALIDRARIVRLRSICDRIRKDWLLCDPLNGLPASDAGVETCMRHVNHPSYFQNKKTELCEVLDTCASEPMLEVVRDCFGEEPMFRSTSLFFNPTALWQEGNWHRDTQFVHKDIAQEQAFLALHALKGGDGIQVQIPLFDSDDLEFIPGSNTRWDTEEELQIRLGDAGAHCRRTMPSGSRITASAGDGVFFDPNGIHRGRYFPTPVRLTLMTTFTRSSAPPIVDRFSYQPWFLEKGYLDGVSKGAKRLYDRFVDHYQSIWSVSRDKLGRLHSGRRS